MRHYIFRKNFDGFIDWIHTLNSIRRTINSYVNTQSVEYRNFIKNDYLEAKKAYFLYILFSKQLNKEELNYIDEIREHHLPSNRKVNVNKIYNLWLDIIANDESNQLKTISKSEIGIVILNARTSCCKSRKQVAEILEINPETLKSYETGKRMIPFDIYYKLVQILNINLNDPNIL